MRGKWLRARGRDRVRDGLRDPNPKPDPKPDPNPDPDPNSRGRADPPLGSDQAGLSFLFHERGIGADTADLVRG